MIKDFKHSTPMRRQQHEWKPRLKWLFDTLGNRGHLWDAEQDRFWFRHESDLILYLLRWS